MKHQKTLLIFLFFGVFIYLLLRAIYVPLLHDEIATFFRYVHINELFPYYSEWSANNHYLNSLLSWVSVQLFGSSEIALRLPNLLFFPLFFYFTYQISQELKNKWLRWGFLLSLLFAHNFLEFFGLTRGYGLSMALLMGAILFAQKALQSNNPKYYIYVFGLMVLGCYANLTLINSFIVLIIILTAKVLISFKLKQDTIKRVGYILFFGVVPVILFTLLLFRLQAEGELYYGKQDGFYEVSIKTLAKLLSGSTNWVFPITGLLLSGFFSIIYFTNIFKAFKRDKINGLLKPKWLFFYLMLGNVIAYILENKIFGTNYPEDRTGLFFFPFFIGSLFFGLDQIQNKFLRFVPALPLLFLPIHFFVNINLSWSSLENQAIPERFYNYVAEQKDDGKFPATIQGYQMRVMRWNYFNFQKGEELNCIHTAGYPRMEGDFQIVEPNHNPDWTQYYNVVDSAKHSGLFLLERKHKLDRELVFSKNGIFSEQEISDEYFEFQRGSLDTLAGNTLYFGFSIKLNSPDVPFHSWLVISISDSHNATIRYEVIPLDWYRSDWQNGQSEFKQGMLVHDIPEGPINYVAYIWNIRKVPFKVNSSSLSIFKLENDFVLNN